MTVLPSIKTVNMVKTVLNFTQLSSESLIVSLYSITVLRLRFFASCVGSVSIILRMIGFHIGNLFLLICYHYSYKYLS